MHYNVNDTVLYGSYGVCRIIEISKKEFGGTESEYYVLQSISNPGSVVYVPIYNEILTGRMRRILSVEEIYQLIRTMPDERAMWVESENERKEVYKQILTSGDHMQLIRMIKALYQHQQERKAKGQKLHIADKSFLKDAENILYEEFAYVLDIERDQVLPLILEQIQLNEKNVG